MARGESWLKAELVKALNWDEFVVEGVVDVVSKAKTADEMQEIVNVRSISLGSPVSILYCMYMPYRACLFAVGAAAALTAAAHGDHPPRRTSWTTTRWR